MEGEKGRASLFDGKGRRPRPAKENMERAYRWQRWGKRKVFSSDRIFKNGPQRAPTQTKGKKGGFFFCKKKKIFRGGRKERKKKILTVGEKNVAMSQMEGVGGVPLNELHFQKEERERGKKRVPF